MHLFIKLSSYVNEDLKWNVSVRQNVRDNIQMSSNVAASVVYGLTAPPPPSHSN